MQALIELIAGFVALLAAAALSQFGLDLDSAREPAREVRRIHDCGEATAVDVVVVAAAKRNPDC